MNMFPAYIMRNELTLLGSMHGNERKTACNWMNDIGEKTIKTMEICNAGRSTITNLRL